MAFTETQILAGGGMIANKSVPAKPKKQTATPKPASPAADYAESVNSEQVSAFSRQIPSLNESWNFGSNVNVKYQNGGYEIFLYGQPTQWLLGQNAAFSAAQSFENNLPSMGSFQTGQGAAFFSAPSNLATTPQNAANLAKLNLFNQAIINAENTVGNNVSALNAKAAMIRQEEKLYSSPNSAQFGSPGLFRTINSQISSYNSELKMLEAETSSINVSLANEFGLHYLLGKSSNPFTEFSDILKGTGSKNSIAMNLSFDVIFPSFGNTNLGEMQSNVWSALMNRQLPSLSSTTTGTKSSGGWISSLSSGLKALTTGTEQRFSFFTNPNTYKAAFSDLMGEGRYALTSGQEWLSFISNPNNFMQSAKGIMSERESYLADFGGLRKYVITPAGAFQPGQKPTAAEQADIARGEVAAESLLPSQVFGSVLELQTAYGGNLLDQFGLGSANFFGNRVAEPVEAAERFGLSSPQFFSSLEKNALITLGMALPVIGTTGAADVAVSAAERFGLGTIEQIGIRLSIGGAVGALGGATIGYAEGAKGSRFWEDVGIYAGLTGALSLVSAPSQSVLSGITRDISESNPMTITSDTAGHFSDFPEGNSLNEFTQTTIKQIMPKFGRFGYFQGLQEVIGKYDIGSALTPVNYFSENGITAEQLDISSSISRSIETDMESPQTSSDIFSGSFLRISRPTLTIERTINAQLPQLTSEAGLRIDILSGQSQLNGDILNYLSGGKYLGNLETTDLFLSNQESEAGEDFFNGLKFKMQSTAGLNKQWLNPIDFKFSTPDDIFRIYNDLNNPIVPKDVSEGENLPPDLNDWLSGQQIENQITNDERYNEFRDQFTQKTESPVVNANKETAPSQSLTIAYPTSPGAEQSVTQVSDIGSVLARADFSNLVLNTPTSGLATNAIFYSGSSVVDPIIAGNMVNYHGLLNVPVSANLNRNSGGIYRNAIISGIPVLLNTNVGFLSNSVLSLPSLITSNSNQSLIKTVNANGMVLMNEITSLDFAFPITYASESNNSAIVNQFDILDFAEADWKTAFPEICVQI